jgi:hypothetical protein
MGSTRIPASLLALRRRIASATAVSLKGTTTTSDRTPSGVPFDVGTDCGASISPQLVGDVPSLTSAKS